MGGSSTGRLDGSKSQQQQRSCRPEKELEEIKKESCAMTTRHGGGDEATATVPEEVWITPFATTEEAVRAAEAHGQEQLPESDSETEGEEGDGVRAHERK